MDVPREFGLFFGLLSVTLLFIWMWCSYVVLFGTGFLLALTVYSRNLPITAGEPLKFSERLVLDLSYEFY